MKWYIQQKVTVGLALALFTMIAIELISFHTLSTTSFLFGSLTSLALILVILFSINKDIAERERVKLSLKESEQKYRRIVEMANEGVWMIDKDRRTSFVNRKLAEMLGYSVEEMSGKRFFDFMDEADRAMATRHIERREEGLAEQHEFRFQRKDGSFIWALLSTHPVTDAQGDYAGALAMILDISDRKQAETQRGHLEAQLLHAQKMESIGRLAGSVAHDFNNLLTAIIGYSQLLMSRLDENDSKRADVEEIIKAGERAAKLTGQLLAFSRRQPLERKVINLNDTINDLLKMLRRIIGENVNAQVNLDANAPLVFCDSGQIEQVIMNLAINARDAMTGGGNLIIEVRDVMLDEEYCLNNLWARPGRYAQVCMTDTGIGMDMETQQHIFEPFFTTKEVGKGTGLGLSVVFGIVKQHDGLIHIYSEPGKGATFRIYLPAHEGIVQENQRGESIKQRGGTETILVAEDEDALREMARNVLTGLGYNVLLAADGEMAVEIYKAHRDAIRLLILDLVMPRAGGMESYNRVRKLGGNVPVLFMTGYSAEMINGDLAQIPGARVIQKPYSITEFIRKVREALDHPAQ